ncbi:hypothetical protein CH330_02655 [candidate division WOR-3 bacterium JGI_Cruoil_03_51_56]|uniref:Outer membrane protein beta-barrel domain-containing protein n=1 Tax=candidate division WOR-3 bacterium JGI_Cruoil_03_51_56 TaxID=1973747 RepID=A0A235BVU6_UNCW3|nr:MAG: hypothetical protein CH330_02655 [candidate division WOR-3 bacterium JGI_Cruoil_03_51_56]
MKSAATAIVVVASLILGVHSANAGVGLCVKPGMLVNGAHLGYKTGNLFAGLGLEFASVSVGSKTTHKYEDTTYTYSSKACVNVFLP